jgi:hypothetical protein
MLKSSEKLTWRCFSLFLTMLALVLFLGDAPLAVASKDGSSHSGSSHSGSSHSGGHGSSHAGKGKRGGSGHDSGDHGSSHVKGKGQGKHGGQSGDSTVTRDRGRRPVWAQEGIPEVELGRLNAARAPDHVLTRSLAEAHAALAADPQASVHSPPQNLALYWEAMSGQKGWSREQAAAFLGAAADKRIPITSDTVRALNLILGVSDADPAGMAQAADNVRQQILADHDQGSSGDH